MAEDPAPASSEVAARWHSLERWVASNPGGQDLLERFRDEDEVDHEALIGWILSNRGSAPASLQADIAGGNFGQIIQAAQVGVLNVNVARRRPEPSRERPVVRLQFSRNADFIGRGELLGRVAAAPRDQPTAIINRSHALAGLGGVGKTQLANEYAHASLEARSFAVVWWVRAEDPSFLTSDLADLGRQLELVDGPAESDVAAAAVLAWLQGTAEPWLLIYDNAPSPDGIEAWLPKGRRGQILITSRERGGWAGIADEVAVDVFDPETATAFLLHQTARDDATGARAVAERLGGHALALNQAAAYVKQTGRTFDDYLIRLQRSADLLGRPAARRDYEHTVAAVVAESRARVEQQQPVAGEVLDVIAYLDPERIPLSLLEESDEQSGFASEGLEAAIEALGSYSLIEVGEGAFSVHRLVQEVTRRGHQDTEAAERAISVVTSRFPRAPAAPEAWPGCAALLPHVTALAAGAADVDVSSVSWLLDRAATYLRASGDARGAIPLYRQALALDQASKGEDDRETLVAMQSLAFALWAQGEFDEARTIEEQVLEVSQRVLGTEHPSTLTSMSNLAETYRDTGDLAGARALQEQALEIRQRVLGAEHPDTLTSMNNLAATLGDQGDLAGARALQEQVVEGSRRVLGAEHPTTLTTLNNLAATLRDQGDPAGARALEEEALEIRQRLLGVEHPDTLTSMNNLAETRRDQGDATGARALHEQVLEIRRRVLGVEHPATLTSMSNLAGTLRDQGDLAGARVLQEQVLEIRRRVLGAEHPDTLGSMNNLATTINDQGDLAGARTLHQQVLEVFERVLGSGHPATLTSMNNLAETLGDQGDLADARALHERALDGRRRVLGAEHPDTIASMLNLAATLHAEGDRAGARALQEQVLVIRRRVLGAEHPATLASMNNLAATLNAEGDLAGARELLEESVRLHRTAAGPAHPLTLSTMGQLAVTMWQQGDLAAARDVEEDVLAGWRTTVGPEHPSTLRAMDNLAVTLRDQMEYDLALSLQEEALEIRSRTSGDRHPSLKPGLGNLVTILDDLGRVEEAATARAQMEELAEE